MSLLRHVREIAELVNEFRSKRLLDYGCGDGTQYSRERCHVVWGVDAPFLYDPRKAQFSIEPAGQFDGVICINYLDNLRADKLIEAARDIAKYSKRWAFIAVSCDGTKKEFDWWLEFLPTCFVDGQKLVIRETK